ncbi:switch-associated protein 70-like isoform X2 [Fagus crenata]
MANLPLLMSVVAFVLKLCHFESAICFDLQTCSPRTTAASRSSPSPCTAIWKWIRRNEPTVKGTIIFEANSTITVSPVNFQNSRNSSCCSANSTALECSKELETAMQISLRNALGMMTNRTSDDPMDDVAIMRETLRVKDEELHNLARDLRAQDSTIKERAEKLSGTAEAAASAAHTMDEQRRIACAEIERVKRDSEKQLESSMSKRDSAIQEAHMWRSELAKARERVVILEAAVVRAEEKVRVAQADAEARIKEAVQKESAAVKEKQELLAYVNKLQTQLQRHHVDTKQVFEEKTESCSDIDNTLPLTKHVDLSEENVDKACLSVSRAIPVPGESVVHMAADQGNPRPIGDGEWSDIQATEARIADVREVAPEIEGSSLDIPVVSQPVSNHHEQGANSFNQP